MSICIRENCNNRIGVTGGECFVCQQDGWNSYLVNNQVNAFARMYRDRWILKVDSKNRNISECNEPGLHYRQIEPGKVIVAIDPEYTAWEFVATILEFDIYQIISRM